MIGSRLHARLQKLESQQPDDQVVTFTTIYEDKAGNPAFISEYSIRPGQPGVFDADLYSRNSREFRGSAWPARPPLRFLRIENCLSRAISQPLLSLSLYSRR